MSFFRSFFIRARRSASEVTRETFTNLVCPRANNDRVHPSLFPGLTQCHILEENSRFDHREQDGFITVFVSTPVQRATSSVVTALQTIGLTMVEVVGVHTENVRNRDRLRDAYGQEALAMYDRFRLAGQDRVASFVAPVVRVDLFNNRRWGDPVRRRRRQEVRSPSSASSASVSNMGVGPVPNGTSPRYAPGSPGYGSRVRSPTNSPGSRARSPSFNLGSPALSPIHDPPVAFPDDPPYVAEFRSYISTHGVQDPDFANNIERFALARLRADGSDLARQVLGVMEPAGEPFVRDFRAFLNTHPDHTHPEFQNQLEAFVGAYLSSLNSDPANYSFALRMFFGFHAGDGFRVLLARIAGGVPLN